MNPAPARGNKINLPWLPGNFAGDLDLFSVRRPARKVRMHRSRTELQVPAAIRITQPQLAFGIRRVTQLVPSRREVQSLDGKAAKVRNKTVRLQIIAEQLSAWHHSYSNSWRPSTLGMGGEYLVGPNVNWTGAPPAALKMRERSETPQMSCAGSKTKYRPSAVQVPPPWLAVHAGKSLLRLLPSTLTCQIARPSEIASSDLLNRSLV